MAPPLVLLVDDNDESRQIYAEHLHLAGFRTLQAANGAIALEKVREIQPAIIVLDYQMPVMDGFETARRLKEDPRTMGIPLVLLTSFAHEPGACPGFEEELEKPCAPEVLTEVIERALRATWERAAHA